MKRHISTHFSVTEVACHCTECDKATADVELVWLLELIRRAFGNRPVSVHSWFRCRAHNNRPKNQLSAAGVAGAGSNDNSWHLIGGAADISIRGVAPEEIQRFMRERFPERYGVGLYDWGVHLDVRPGKGDWDERTKITYVKKGPDVSTDSALV